MIFKRIEGYYPNLLMTKICVSLSILINSHIHTSIFKYMLEEYSYLYSSVFGILASNMYLQILITEA